MTTSTHVDVARVETPTQVIDKAKVTMTERHLVVYDRRSGQVLVELDDIEKVDIPGGTAWRYGDGPEAVIVERKTGCGCGGTTIMELKR